MAECARLNQPQLSKIINGKVYDIQIDVLVCICLVLQLNLEQTADLLSRAERALSPASSVHRAYKELIGLYAAKPFDCVGDETMLDEADRFLKEKSIGALPNVLAY